MLHGGQYFCGNKQINLLYVDHCNRADSEIEFGSQIKQAIKMFQLLTINVISVSLISTAGSPPVPHRIKSGLQVAEKIAVHGLVSRGGADLFQMVCCDLEPVCSVRGQWAPPCIVALLSVLLLDTRRCRSLM